jgi:hypothetical protein
MVTRSLTIVASLTLVCMGGFYSQAIPVSDDAQRSIASRQPHVPDEDNRSAAISDAADDASEDHQLTDDTLNWPSSSVPRPRSQWNAQCILASDLRTNATLESQHVLLRL